MARSTCFAPFRLTISPATHTDHQQGNGTSVAHLTTLATLHKSVRIDESFSRLIPLTDY